MRAIFILVRRGIKIAFMRITAIGFFIVLMVANLLQAGTSPTTRSWTIGGVTREAALYVPATAKTQQTPVIFAFHGHGGTIKTYSRHQFFPVAWPEALVVYPRGLPTPGRLTDKEGKAPGWQAGSGEQGDRDLKFFDAMLESLKKDYDIDPLRIYVTGHSNGGTFTYVLWETRGEEIAAFAPISCSLSMTTTKPAATEMQLRDVAPRPILHIGGKNDPLVKIEWQEATVAQLRTFNHCGEGKAWDQHCTIYPSESGAPVLSWFHSGKHAPPNGAVETIVKFFKEFSIPASTSQPQQK